MSHDLTIWYDPRLRDFDRAMARLDREGPPSSATRRRLSALVDALRAGPLTDEAMSAAPVLDARRGTLGLCLTAGGLDRAWPAVLPVLRAHGMACWDPEEAVVYYADGSSSVDEKVTAGVHEGVPICLAELAQDPPPPVGEQLDALEALLQFALADSPDEAAAVRLALPGLLALVEGGVEPVAQRAKGTIIELCETLRQRGRSFELDVAVASRVGSVGDAALVQAIRGCITAIG